MNKKQKEFSSFSNFSQKYFGREIEFMQPDPPAPDVVFHLNNKKIGCELTTIFIDNIPGKKSSVTKKNESIHNTIQKKILEWLDLNLPHRYEVQLYFNNRIIHNSQVNSITQKIIDVIENNISELNFEVPSRVMVQDRNQIPLELDYVRIRTFPELKRNVITEAGGSAIPKLKKDKIILNIKHKEDQLSKSSYFTDLNWLLLIINESIFSSEFETIGEEYSNIETLFDKVFIFSYSDHKILTIK